jgi:hypothetical protein
MVDFRVPDKVPELPAHRALGLAPNGLWAVSGAYCMREFTDGWVPRHFVESWPQGRAAARKLVDAALWRTEDRDGVPGFHYVDWSAQRTVAQVMAERDAAKTRMSNIRKGTGARSGSGDVRANTPRTFTRSSAAGSANVHDSLSLSPGGHLGRERPVGERAREGRPLERCTQHATDEHPPACHACGNARHTAEAWDAQQARRAVEARSADARRRAEDRARAIAACSMCDGNGYLGRLLCDHDPAAADRAARGRAVVQAALNGRSPGDNQP